jgi:thiosulfate dehydrogenase
VGKFIAGLLVGFLLIAICAYGYFALGYAPAAAAAAPMPFEKRMAKMALRARIKKEMPQGAAIPATEANLLAGAETYKRECAVCHGLPDQKQTNIAAGMYPKPPQLFVHGVTDDPVGETYWKIANGIRLTGMPAFKGTSSDDAIWQVSLLLANADKLPPTVTEALHQQPTPGVPPPNDILKFPVTK